MCNTTEPTSPLSLKQAIVAVLMTPIRLSKAVKDVAFEVLWDSGASFSVTFCKHDFVGPIKSVGLYKTLSGLAKGLLIQGVGVVEWHFMDEAGELQPIRVTAYYVPTCPL